VCSSDLQRMVDGINGSSSRYRSSSPAAPRRAGLGISASRQVRIIESDRAGAVFLPDPSGQVMWQVSQYSRSALATVPSGSFVELLARGSHRRGVPGCLAGFLNRDEREIGSGRVGSSSRIGDAKVGEVEAMLVRERVNWPLSLELREAEMR
jgi:hypothetical protein